ncbi:hypothetical protein [Nostoc sp.]
MRHQTKPHLEGMSCLGKLLLIGGGGASRNSPSSRSLSQKL